RRNDITAWRHFREDASHCRSHSATASFRRISEAPAQQRSGLNCPGRDDPVSRGIIRDDPPCWRDPMTPDDYRRRYFELKHAALEAAQTLPKGKLPQNPKTIPAELVLVEETLPPGWYWTCRLSRGQSLRLINSEATHGVSALLWNAADPTERYN